MKPTGRVLKERLLITFCYILFPGLIQSIFVINTAHFQFSSYISAANLSFIKLVVVTLTKDHLTGITPLTFQSVYFSCIGSELCLIFVYLHLLRKSV